MQKMIFLSLISGLFVFSPFHSEGQEDSSDKGWTTLAPFVGEDTVPPDEEFMYLDLNKDYYESLGVEPPLYEINTTEEYGDSAWRDSVSNCEIPFDEEGAPSSKLICTLDIMEGDLNKDISLVLNVPKGMCSTITTTPAWHWNKKPTAQELDIGGPGRTSWDAYNENGLPLSITEYTGEGIQKRVDIKSLPIEVPGDIASIVSGDIPFHSTPIANYIGILDQSLNDVLNINTQELPVFLQSFQGVFPNPYYTFTCQDDKLEIKHAIHLMIQEWNTPKQFINHSNSRGAAPSDPNITGAEGKSCDLESTMEMGLCNDLCDLEDIDPKTGHSLCKSSTGYPEATYKLE